MYLRVPRDNFNVTRSEPKSNSSNCESRFSQRSKVRIIICDISTTAMSAALESHGVDADIMISMATLRYRPAPTPLHQPPWVWRYRQIHQEWVAVKTVALILKENRDLLLCLDYKEGANVTKDLFPTIKDWRLSGYVRRSKGIVYSGLQEWLLAGGSTPPRIKSMFAVGQGLWQFRCLNFGLWSARGTVERLMEAVLRGLKSHTKCIWSTRWWSAQISGKSSTTGGKYPNGSKRATLHLTEKKVTVTE